MTSNGLFTALANQRREVAQCRFRCSVSSLEASRRAMASAKEVSINAGVSVMGSAPFA
jgi:hypothetical protein